MHRNRRLVCVGIRTKLDLLAGFTTNPAGSAIVNTIDSMRTLVGSGSAPDRATWSWFHGDRRTRGAVP
jgi:hypothetical protein